MKELLKRIKNNAVLYISGVLAFVSCFVVFPDKEYVSYINFRVLAILFCLMLIVAALSHIGTFDVLTTRLLKHFKTPRSVSLLMIIMSFFMSMLLTNDVTLVTLVPFAILVMEAFNDRKTLMYTLILMTVAANLGSMLTPIGNPQNLYLYSRYEMELPSFILLMLPYAALSLLILIVMAFILIKSGAPSAGTKAGDDKKIPIAKLLISIALFVINILTVAGFVHYLISLGVTVAVMIFADRKAFRKVDYQLLLTFVFFFVLIGNLGRIPAIHDNLTLIVAKNPVIAAVLSSQIISNVPAAMLLSAFTDNGTALVIGTNLGGLGTIIASMASLITYKFHGALAYKYSLSHNKEKGGNYLLSFTVVNIVTLALLMGLYFILNR